MKFSESWLREWVDLDVGVDGLAELLTMGGLEVAAVTPAAPPLTGVVVAELRNVDPHPLADSLAVCRVHDGDDEHTVVCGAPNARAGLRSAYAPPGVTLPGERAIDDVDVRGVTSAGMLCSPAELGLGDDAAGIVELSDDAPVGTDLSAYLDLTDRIVDIDLTPNRGDCFCVTGIARDVAALAGVEMRRIDVAAVAAANAACFAVELDDPAGCPRYACRVIEGLNAAAPTPMWMQERLRRAGVRGINALVDVTNYVMLELGQPMHAFDRDKLTQKIVVRQARAGERLMLLDGGDIELDQGTLVIADGAGPVALAGVLGGEPTSVSGITTSVLLESAFFEPVRLAGVARSYGLHTDASTRFERGVDPAGQARAIERATALIVDICGGTPGSVAVTEDSRHMPARAAVTLRPRAVGALLGIDLDDTRVRDILLALDMAVEAGADGWRVIPPSFRFDIAHEVDLIEEVARVHGYAALPAALPVGQARPALPVMDTARERDMRALLGSRGFFEAITYSFIDPDLARLLEPEGAPVALSNPISSEMSVMRRSLWPGLLNAARHNLNRRHDAVRLFEIGMVFRDDGAGLRQARQVGAVAGGRALPEQWGAGPRECDFFDLKQDVDTLLQSMGYVDRRYAPAPDPALHPGQSASLLVHHTEVGRIGALHPRIALALDIDKSLFLFEIDIDSLPESGTRAFAPLSKYPPVRRDISVVVGETISAQDCLSVAREAGGALLRDLQLFDVYRGQGIDSDKKSLTMGLIFQTASRTLTEDEVEIAREQIVDALAQRVGGTLRE